MPLKDIISKFIKKSADTKTGTIESIDEETLEIARQLAFEKKLKRDVNAKWKRGKKGGGDDSDDEIAEALRELKPDASAIMKRVFERTVEDTVLANKFVDQGGKQVAHLTVKKAIAMDGLRDLDDDVAVSGTAASPMNPEGRFNIPMNSGANHVFADRFNEAMNPVRNGRYRSVIPETILEHFANFATFIGYPACGLIGTHPTVSNACTIPGEDAIAPGYSLSFVDSDDLDENGIPDDLETAEMGGVRRSLGRIGAMESLKEAIVALSEAETKNDASSADGASVDALARVLERLAAYEEWEREYGAGDNAAKAVNEGFVKPLTEQFVRYSQKPDADSRKSAYTALSLALSDLAKREHPVLDEVRSNQKRRGTVEAVRIAITTISKPEQEWDSVKSLNDLAVAVERVAAYEKYSDTNAEILSALNMALIDLSTRQKPDEKESALRALNRAVEAMDADDFAFEDPNAPVQQIPQNQQIQQLPPQPSPEEMMWNQRQAEQLERERQEDRQTKAALAAHNAEAKEGRINELHKQKMDFLNRRELARQQAEAELAGAKGRSVEAQESRAAEAHQQKMDIAQRMADQKLQQQQAQFEAQMQQANAQQQQAQAQQQQADEEKRKADDKREKTRIAAEVAKERQKYLDQWKQRADDMGMNDICSRLARNARMFGIGIAVPVVDGVNYEEPINFDNIKEGAYHGFTVIEPMWIYPEVESDDLVNPLSPSFFEPMYWAATGSSTIGNLAIRRIHRSWMIIVRNKEVPNTLRPMYYYGGIPMPQLMYEAVFCADKVMNEVPKLAMTKRTTVVKGDPNDLVTNPEGVVERLGAFSQVQDNFGILYVGRNADVVKLETSLSEFDQLISKANQRIAAIAEMPESKLFKAQLAGSFQTGAYEMRDYWSLLMRIQKNWFTPLLTMHYKLDTKSRTGKVIELKITFNPVDVPTDSEKGEAENRAIQTINSAIQGGWLAPAEARMLSRSREDSMFSSISAEMPEELEQQQQQGGGMPGMPGMGGLPGMEGDEGGMNPIGALQGGETSSDGKPKDPEEPESPDDPKEYATMKEAKGLEEPKDPGFSAPKIASIPQM